LKLLISWALLVTVAVTISGCHRKKPAPVGPDLRLKLFETIQARFHEPYTTPPGTTFATVFGKDKDFVEIIPQGSGGGVRSSGTSSESGEYNAGFVLDLKGLNPKAFFQKIDQICGHQVISFPENADTLRGWDEFSEWAKKGDGASKFAYWISMFYADRFSGLGLSRSDCSLSMTKVEEGHTVVVGNSDRSNMIFITTWVSLPQGRAYVHLSFAAHWGEESHASWGTPGSWGTRPLELSPR
jgi:hypothetical protein